MDPFATPHPEETAKVCPACGKHFGEESKFCTEDGTPLASSKPEADPMVGQVLMDRWEVVDLLGAGGFALVYRVRDRATGAEQALKVFRRQRVNPKDLEEAVTRFRREATLLKQLGNLTPHILGVSDLVESRDGDTLYLPMELLVGESLSEILVRDGPFPTPRIVEIVKQVCRGLEAAHGHGDGVVHRDLTLDNIMVTEGPGGEPVMKILDFGIAKAIGQDGLTNLSIGGPGTPAFAAPEQVEGRPVDQRTDLFTLGVVLYGMMTGHEPWLGGRHAESISGGWKLLRQTVDGEPIPVSRFNPDADPGLVAITMKLLEKRPEDRFQSAREVWEALDAVGRGERPAIEARTTHRFRVVHAQRGVGIRIRKGWWIFRQTVAEGATPWEAEDFPPGSYRVELADPRYEPEVREVDVVEGQDVQVVMTARKS